MRQSRTRLSRLPPRLTREADERPPVADPVLEIEDLRVRFHMRAAHGHDYVVRAVDGVDIAVGRRETLGIVGESGCGKSVTSLAVMRLVPSPPGSIASGSIRLQRRDLLRLEEEEMRRIRGNRISMIFQEPMTSLNPVFSGRLCSSSRSGSAPARATCRQAGSSTRSAVEPAGRWWAFRSTATRLNDYPHQFSAEACGSG